MEKYAIAFIMDEENKCKRFEGGLRIAIHTLVTTSVDWSDFSKMFGLSVDKLDIIKRIVRINQNWQGTNSNRSGIPLSPTV